MPSPYTQEQLNKIYEKLPEELQDALYSMETAESISTSCETYGIEDERVSKIARYAGQVLMGIILPSEFQKVLEQNIDMPKVLAEAIARNINRLVFYPVKPALEQLHDMSMGKKGVPEEEGPLAQNAPASAAISLEPETIQEQKPKTDDSYREPIE